jgi:hypothetical protein
MKAKALAACEPEGGPKRKKGMWKEDLGLMDFLRSLSHPSSIIPRSPLTDGTAGCMLLPRLSENLLRAHLSACVRCRFLWSKSTANTRD